MSMIGEMRATTGTVIADAVRKHFEDNDSIDGDSYYDQTTGLSFVHISMAPIDIVMPLVDKSE